jgi:hypothetical protein
MEEYRGLRFGEKKSTPFKAPPICWRIYFPT